MGTSFICYSFAICMLLAGPSFGLYRDGSNSAFQQESDRARLDSYRHFYPARTAVLDAQQSLKQEMLNTFIAQLLQSRETLADTEQWGPSLMLDEELADEEADQLTALTRYVGIGYNLLKGSPDGDFLSGGVDPGVLTTRTIFDFTYKEGKDAYYMDATVQVPDQVNFQPIASCSTNSRASVYSGAKSYQNSLNFGINAKAAAFGFQFGLSTAIKRAKEETAEKKRVLRDQKQICNHGHVRYLTESKGIHTISKSFYDRVNSLPRKYSAGDYMQLIRDYGTHLIVEVDLGTKNITRSSYEYKGVYQQLKTEASGGISVGGNVNGQGGSLGLDIGYINANGNNYTKYTTKFSGFIIGTKKNPFPIYLSLWNISEALRPEYWTTLATYESLGIDQKKRNLERALADYADYEGVDTLTDPRITIDNKWPNGKYALPAPEGNCPKGWSRGQRTQGTGSNVDVSSGITSRLGVKLTAKTITLHYCVKDNEDTDGGIGYDWPQGSYCVAKRGDLCPEDTGPAFKEGSISWNDYKSRVLRKSSNKRWGVLPEGVYGKNTNISFCCRNDNPASRPMILPIKDPFVLYRYGGECQSVIGTMVMKDFIQYDDTSRAFSKNNCIGAHPDDDNCKGKHRLHFCHYSRK